MELPLFHLQQEWKLETVERSKNICLHYPYVTSSVLHSILTFRQLATIGGVHKELPLVFPKNGSQKDRLLLALVVIRVRLDHPGDIVHDIS